MKTLVITLVGAACLTAPILAQKEAQKQDGKTPFTMRTLNFKALGGLLQLLSEK